MMYPNPMTGLFWLAHQQGRMEQGEDIARQAIKRTSGLKSEIRNLRASIDKLTLINRALWEIIAADKGLTDEYLIDKVNEIDLRDGKLDGKTQTAVRVCSSCGRTLFQGHRRCLYCGSENLKPSPFE